MKVKIEKIIIESYSGFCSVSDAYEDILILNSNGQIRYEYTPIVETELNVKQQFDINYYNDSHYQIMFEMLCIAFEKLINSEKRTIVTDAGGYDIQLIYNNSKIVIDHFDDELSDEIVTIIMDLFPSNLRIPMIDNYLDKSTK